MQSRECSPDVLERLAGSVYFPERRLGAAIVSGICRGRDRVLYVTAPEISDARAQVDYYLSLVPADPRERPGARADRVTLVSVPDASSQWLSTKVLDAETAASAEARSRIRDFADRQRQAGAAVMLSYYEPSAKLERFAGELGVAGDQADSRYIRLGTKAAGRQIFAGVGIDVPPGTRECRSVDDLAEGLADLVRLGHHKFVLKLSSTEYGGGLGNALLDLSSLRPELASSTDVASSTGLGERIAALLPLRTVLVDTRLGWPSFAEAITRSGVVGEQLIEGAELTSPSYQGAIDAGGVVTTTSTHDQVLGSRGQVYAGSVFPARPDYRDQVIGWGLRAGRGLAELGVRGGDYGVDFVAVRTGGDWRLFGCEINLRSTATKHGFIMATSLLGVLPDASGRLMVDSTERVYHVSDGVADPRYFGLRPRQLIAAVQRSPLRYDSVSQTGVVLHMMSAAFRYAKFGALAIGTDRAEAGQLIARLRDLVTELADERAS
jgi:hypothetical protein